MGLFSFLQGSSASAQQRTGTPDPVQAARSRARRRLIGAAVLLGVGVIGFPLLFETQPRPIPVDIPIEIPRKEGAPSLPLPPPRNASSAAAANARVSSGVITERSAEPRRDAASGLVTTAPRTETIARNESPSRSEPTTRSEPPSRGDAAVANAPAPKPAAKPDPRSNDGVRARALLEGRGPAASAAETATSKPATAVATIEAGKPDAATSAAPKAEPAKSDAANARFVVQVGAYGEAASARDMRQRVDKLGLKSYTQVEVDGVRRIRVRVGPFVAREDAEKAAGTLKGAGLPAAVFTL
jgi:DedD protein